MALKVSNEKIGYREFLLFPRVAQDKVLYPDIARELVAKACDGQDDIDPIIFNRQENGHTVHRKFGSACQDEGFGATPSVVFGGGKGFVRLTGIGPAGVTAIKKNALKIVQALCVALDDDVFRTEVREGKCSLALSESARGYYIKNLVVSKSLREINECYMDDSKKLLDAVEVQNGIKRVIYRGLVGQAMGLDEETGLNIESVLPDFHSFDVQIFDGQLKIGKIKKDVAAHALFAMNVRFTMPLRLIGPWYVGHLRSRGYGLIRSAGRPIIDGGDE